jgi:predicted outer membrane lipoprotein
MAAIADGLKDEEAKNLQNAAINITRLKEQHRVELEEIKLQQGEKSEVYRKAKERQAAELNLAFENERKQELQYAAWIIQQEIDKNDRVAIEAGKATEEYFKARQDKINAEFEKEMKLADGNANAIENARTKQYKASLDLDIERLQAKESLIQKGLDGEYENTQAFFNKQRDLENANYATQQKEYQLNFDMLENLKKDHDKKMAMIDASQLQYASDYFTRRADTEKKHYGDMFKDLRLAEDMAYEARKKAAGNNAQELELIELEHLARLKEITNQEIQAYASVATAMADSFANVANALAAVYQLESENSKKTMEERKAAFEQSKKYQKAAALLSAASGIINILTQPSTLPSPFDWIVKIANAAALGIMTAVQIKKIDQTEFNGGGGSGSGSSGNTLGRNYGDGGYIDGPRHAQGGVPITAEGGEAIMTRGAVTAFAPMLSMMNQMGGGKSFVNGIGKPYYDNPKTQNVVEESKPIIMKSYVVSNDMKTEMEKQSRLKDLSTL